ncbi:MAG: glycerol-3-phosphate dehydrogenase [Hyphomicrobiaceae bacterium]
MYDLAIIGGGINGCGIARDAVGRGYSVFLAEKDDLACGTSSGSTKLIHGGLRYLEHYEFRLVRESLKEREVLWAMAPHIVWPLRFILPHSGDLRPAWLLRLGLFLYDHIGGRKLLPGTRTIDLRNTPLGEPIRSDLVKGFEYSDCWVEDSRLVVLNARDAVDRGAEIRTRTAFVRLRRTGDHWEATVRDSWTGQEETIQARLIINAAGPWVDSVLGQVAGYNSARNIRLVQGSHIVVKKFFEHDRAYIFQNPDGRIFFVIPYEQDFALIGTTDRDYAGKPDKVEISPEEVNYLLDATRAYLRTPITRDDIVWSFSAVRPLFDDGSSSAQEATRDYVVKLEGNEDEPKLVNIFGGKITTYRRLAESVLDHVDQAMQRSTRPWTGSQSLPGGNFAVDGFEQQVHQLLESYSFLGLATATRLVRAYGTLAKAMLGDARSEHDLGRQFGATLSEREVTYLQSKEWAVTAEDILWRRTKLGLRLRQEEVNELQSWLASHRMVNSIGAV